MSDEEIEQGIAIENAAGTANAELAQKILDVRRRAEPGAGRDPTRWRTRNARSARVIRDAQTALVTFKGAADDLARLPAPAASLFETPSRRPPEHADARAAVARRSGASST